MKKLTAWSICFLLGCGPVALAQTGATKEKPFVNSLGMKFAPVPGPQLLFCIWDTRVQDYRAYAEANPGVDASWKNPGFKQGGDHPVVNVSWEDARAFCAWLTRKERAEGKIGNDQEYRLPTDYEWTLAVGSGEYPWGYDWPPPRGIFNLKGNYGPALKLDKFANTSPVGSFLADQFGLHDMGGNVWQWCGDWYHAWMNTNSWLYKNPPLPDDGGGAKFRAARGAGWKDADSHTTMSLYCNAWLPGTRAADLGFRCVLASTPDLSQVKTEDLIAMLQNETNPGIREAGFMPIEYQPEVMRRIMGWDTLPLPVISPVMRELEKRGTAALPALLEHVSDERATGVMLSGNGWGGVVFENWYDARVQTKNHMPIGLPPPADAPDHEKPARMQQPRQAQYNVKVGDLCYAVIGQIVNRNLTYRTPSAGSPAPTGIDSPVASPQLAAAVRADWKGLTPDDHRKSLDEDGLFTLGKLLYYYPQAGTAKALKLLGGEFYDEAAVGRVITINYSVTPDKAAIEKEIAAFRKKSGEVAYHALELQLLWESIADYNPGPNAERQKALMAGLVKDLFPGVDPAHPPDFVLASFGNDAQVLDEVGDFPSAEIDDAVYALLKRVAGRPVPPATGDSDDEQFARWHNDFIRFEFVCDCIWRLTLPKERGPLLKTLQAMCRPFLINKPGPKMKAAFDAQFDKFLQEEIAKLASK